MDGHVLTLQEPAVRNDPNPLPPVTGGERDLPADGSTEPMPPFVPPAEDGAGREAEEPEGHAGFAWGDDDGAEDPAVAVELVARESFPMDAFIIPEDAERLPAPARVRASRSVTDELARRLVEFAETLRTEGAEAITLAMDEEPGFESQLGAFLFDYIASQSE